ncbi:MAG: transaldolase [Spirochaetes bacterium]|nr:transaldolase [Spirochaetota bacterium]
MKIFIDSADLDEIAQAFDWGVCDGVTTNPSLMKKAVDRRAGKGEKLDLRDYIARILTIAKGTPVSLEVTEFSAQGMAAQGIRIYELFNPVAENVVIKIPVSPAFKDGDPTHFDGLKAVRDLSGRGIPVNCTLIFTPEQALLAAKAGAAYVSPFAGRIDDLLRSTAGIVFEKSDYYPADGMEGDGEPIEDNGIVSGIDLVEQCVDVLDIHGFDAEVIAASLRNPRQAREAALAGSQIATLPFGVIRDMLKHQKTYEGMELFTRDIVPEYVKMLQ